MMIYWYPIELLICRRSLVVGFVGDQVWAHLNNELHMAGHCGRDILTPHISFESPLVATVFGYCRLRRDFVGVVKEPLKELHIVLKSPFRH
jgi:hypothetical protein